MSDLVARTGRHQQRYEDGYRLLAGCIPFKCQNTGQNCEEASEKKVEVLMINSTSGPGLLFPKGGWETDETAEAAAIREAMEEAGVRGDLVHFLGYYAFKSKTVQEECSPEGLCKAAMYALHVNEVLESWPEKSLRERSWLAIPEAIESCRHVWMRDALEKGFLKWCIPIKYWNTGQNCGEASEKKVEVLMINSTSGPCLLFPKSPYMLEQCSVKCRSLYTNLSQLYHAH